MLHLLIHCQVCTNPTSSVVPLDHTLTTRNALWKLHLVVVHCGSVWSKQASLLANNFKWVLIQAFLGCGYQRIVMGTEFELQKYEKVVQFCTFKEAQ